MALLEDTPEERARYEQMEDMRELAGAKGASFDHVNAYTKHNYLAGILHALEATRTRLSIKTAEELIDYLYIGATLSKNPFYPLRLWICGLQ